MDLVTQSKVEQFARLVVATGLTWCGVQEAIPPVLPCLVVKKGNSTRCLQFDPNNFDPIEMATLYLAPQEKKMTDSPKLNLRQKLIQVYTEIDHVEKAGRNNKQNYNFVRAADVLRAVRTAFAGLGVYAETNYELLGTYDIKTNSGGIMHTATVKATIKLYDANSDETMTISGLGDGADGGDKGIYKAMTGATKNTLRNAFLLPDEADPEADETVDSSVGNGSNNNQEDPPDFQEARHAAPKPATAQKITSETAHPTAAPAPPAEAPKSESLPIEAVSTTSADSTKTAKPAVAPQTTSVAQPPAREPGDEDEALPAEEEMTAYRKKFSKLGDDLSTEGKLKSSKGLPINRKLLVFLLGITGVTEAKDITKARWDDFFARVEKAKGMETGLVGLAKLVNKANGIEDKK